ncbi:hypothetical protein ACFLZP_03350 [Patescibacteria group bacterium]
MKKIAFFSLILAASFIFGLVIFSGRIQAITKEDCEQRVGKDDLGLEDLRTCEGFFKNLLDQTENQERSLEVELERFDRQISLASARIAQTEDEVETLELEIEVLKRRVFLLDQTLDEVAALLIKRIEGSYKKSKIDPLLLVFSSQNFSQLVTRLKYLRSLQLHDQKLLLQMEKSKKSYQEQQEIKLEKQTALEKASSKLQVEKKVLGAQARDKQRFLEETQGNKKHFQELLNVTRAEVEAIQKIIAGQGECAEASSVSQGERIAQVIKGASACSTGTHLHFEVRENEVVKNPLEFLGPAELVDNSDGDSFAVSGSWGWPLIQPIKFHQGFGSETAAIRSRVVWYNFHTGIDISSNNLEVKAVQPGKLYRCAIACGGGTLRYVWIDHHDSQLATYYLHVNY